MASRIIFWLTVCGLVMLGAQPSSATSSINTTIPQNGVPYSPAPIRSNFGAAATDISALQSLNAGATAPSSPSPGTWWLDTSGITTYELKIFDGRGNAWLHVASLDTVNNIWMPPVGGGLLPTILSATTTDLGSAPQASLYISGNSSIQSFGGSAPVGAIKFVIFQGSPTLVNVPGSLSLPNSADISQLAGDVAIALHTSSSEWQVLFDSRSANPTSLARAVLTGAGNLYVATTGSDSNNNCSNQLSPCQTMQHACNIATTNYDLAGQNLFINVSNGTYTSGCTIAGQFVGAATTQGTSPSIYFPATGVQIIGNLSSPAAAIIADTSSPSVAPAVFMASQGAYFTVKGFTISSVNGYGLRANSNSIIQWGNMVFGNAGVAQISAHANGVAMCVGNYTISGSARAHLETASGGLAQIGGPNGATTITIGGTPTFSEAFAWAHDHSIIAVASNTTFSGSAIGPRFRAEDASVITTNSGPTFLPGDSLGSLIDNSSHSDPLPVTSVSSTGLGAGGTIAPNGTVPTTNYAGAFTMVAGTSGAAATGQITFFQPTFQHRICVPTPGGGFLPTATTSVTAGQLEDQTNIVWDNGGVPLTASGTYHVHYICAGFPP